jgi:hypothetical protein
MGEGTLFLETVVGPDGNVSSTRVLEGGSEGSGAVVDAFRKEHFKPVFLGGRPVYVAVYHLITSMDVVAPSI